MGVAASAAGVAGLTSCRATPPADDVRKVRVALAIFANSGDRETWPYPGYDTGARRKEILDLLQKGCPDVEFVPVDVAAKGDEAKALELQDRVDGYLIYLMTINWDLDGPLARIGRIGKPLLIVDEFLGGCGVFLCSGASLHRQGIPAARVSTTRPADLVALAGLFAGIRKPGVTPASFARKCRDAYHGTFAAPGDMTCAEDKVPLTEIGECVRRLRSSRFLIVGAGREGRELNFLGIKGL